MQDILSRGKTAVIAGGTGLYVDSLDRRAGRSRPSRRPASAKRSRRSCGEDGRRSACCATLRAVDPDAAARLHPADEKRIIRALEVYAETGQTITQHNLDTQADPPALPARLDRAGLSATARFCTAGSTCGSDLMLQAGLLDEIRALLARGVSPRTTAMQAIGYKEFFGRAGAARSTLDEAAADSASSARATTPSGS